MTVSVERDGSSSRALDGRIHRLGPGWYLGSFRLPTAMPIPLGISAPGSIDLATWAFAGMTAPARTPTCLLIMRPRDPAAETALAAGTRLVVATHFHDIAVSAVPAADALVPEHRAVTIRALLSSVTSATVAALADLVPLLAPALCAEPVTENAPDLAIAEGRPHSCTLSGSDVPNYILFETGSAWRCARVAEARLIFAPHPRMDLDLAPLWGPETGPPGRVILIGDGRYKAARLGAAEA